MVQRRYRVAQWATGHTGLRCLKDVIAHPQYDLVGVYVYSQAKVGKDAGELCGLERTGITATGDIEDILAAKPDCVMYMPLMDHHSIDDMRRILASGANIVTSATYFHHPRTLDPDARAKLEAACTRGGTSLYDTGGAPGFITEIFPLAATMMERRLDRYSVVQFANVSHRQSPEFLNAWFGIDPATADLRQGDSHLADTDGAALRQLGDALSTPLDDITTSASVAVAKTTTKIGVTTIAAGTVGAWRLNVTGLRAGNPYLQFSRTMYVTKDLDPDWHVGDTGWHVIIEGDAPMDIEIRFPTPELYHPISAGYNSHVPVNCVAGVCDAPPGLRTTDELRLVPNFS
jgi:4-hydroxy-tetrahydrodipicolinate reductase